MCAVSTRPRSRSDIAHERSSWHNEDIENTVFAPFATPYSYHNEVSFVENPFSGWKRSNHRRRGGGSHRPARRTAH